MRMFKPHKKRLIPRLSAPYTSRDGRCRVPLSANRFANFCNAVSLKPLVACQNEWRTENANSTNHRNSDDISVDLGVYASALAKDTVKIAFIGPLTGGNSAAGLGGRNSAQLAVNLHNANPTSRYNFELVTQDDECKPNTGISSRKQDGVG